VGEVSENLLKFLMWEGELKIDFSKLPLKMDTFSSYVHENGI